MDFVQAKELLDLGGLMGFAYLVWVSLREQTKILRQLTAEMVKISQRQVAISDKQREIAHDINTQHRANPQIPIRATQ